MGAGGGMQGQMSRGQQMADDRRGIAALRESEKLATEGYRRARDGSMYNPDIMRNMGYTDQQIRDMARGMPTPALPTVPGAMPGQIAQPAVPGAAPPFPMQQMLAQAQLDAMRRQQLPGMSGKGAPAQTTGMTAPTYAMFGGPLSPNTAPVAQPRPPVSTKGASGKGAPSQSYSQQLASQSASRPGIFG